MGNKALQFERLINEIGFNPNVPKDYKFIHKIYENGFYYKIDF